MNSLWLSSISENKLEQAKASPNFFNFLLEDKDLYRTSFEHYHHEHLNLLHQNNLFSTRFLCHEVAEGVYIISPETVEMYAQRLNYIDLTELSKIADLNLGEQYDSYTFMQIVKSRLIPILNYSAIHHHYLTLDLG